MKFTIQLLLLVIVLLNGCGSADSVAGNGTETGNPRIIGIAAERSGKPVPNAQITAYPKAYSPFGKDLVYRTTADYNGQFTLELPDTGSFTIIVVNANRALGISINSTIRDTVEQLNTVLLDSTKTVIIRRETTQNNQDIYIEGTPFSASFAKGVDSTTITGIPVGTYSFIDLATETAILETVIDSNSNSVITKQIKPLVMVVAPYNWNSSTKSVELFTQVADTGKFRFKIADATETGTILHFSPELSALVLLPGSEQFSGLISIVDTLSIPVVVIGSGWCSNLHMIESSNEGVDSLSTIRIDGSNFGDHPILQSFGVSTIAPLQIYDSAEYLTWRIPAPSADVLAYHSDYPAKAYLFVYESGDAMFGAVARGRRATLPFLTGTLSEDGRILYRNLLNWCLE